MSRANPRAICVQAMNRWESEKKFADELLHESLGASQLTTRLTTRVPHRERSTASASPNLSRLDFLIAQLRDAPVDSSTRQILRLGFYQVFHMRIPHHAAVNETVNLAGKARGLVNALLRRGIRESDALQQKLDQMPAATRYSHAEFLVTRWKDFFGANETQQLCEWNNSPAEVYVRANGLKVTTGELLRSVSEAEAFRHPHPMAIKTRQIPLPVDRARALLRGRTRAR